MAPEIYRDNAHNCLADYYNIGTLTFEFVTGRVPKLNSEDRSFDDKQLLENLNISPGLQDFIIRLLDHTPETRLGAKKGLNEICSHPWLQNLNMSDVLKKRLNTPITIDPYSVKFNSRKINYDIDFAEDSFDEYTVFGVKHSPTTERNLYNFSFYGFPDQSQALTTLSMNPPSFNKIPTMNNISAAYSPYASSIIRGASTGSGLSRFNTLSNLSNKCDFVKKMGCDETQEVNDEKELANTKVKMYTSKKSKGMEATKTENNLAKLTPYFSTSSPLLSTCHI